MLTAERLRECLLYDPLTGIFTWLITPSVNVTAGEKAGSVNNTGHVRISVDGHRYQAHRLAWLYVTGKFPPGRLDHHDMDKTNNKFDNLRLATQSQNVHNRVAPKNNTSGFKGVCFHKRKQLWQAYITVRGKQRCLGYFDTPDEAHFAYAKAAEFYFCEFARAA